MNDIAHCDGITWILTTLHGQPHRLHARDCPRRRDCVRFRLHDEFMSAGDPDARVSYVETPEHGTTCEEFLP